MTTTIWIHQARPRTAWYELGDEKKRELRDRWNSLDTAAVESGAEHVGTYSVRGQSDYSTVEVWRFESPERVFDFWNARVAADYAVWFAFSNQVGSSVS
jgi:hypothetical protein